MASINVTAVIKKEITSTAIFDKSISVIAEFNIIATQIPSVFSLDFSQSKNSMYIALF